MQRSLANGLVLTSQATLWAACGLALLGLFGRTIVPGFFTVFLLALFVSLLVLLSHGFDRFPTIRRRQVLFVLPAVLFGLFFVLPSPWAIVFLAVLGLVELAWWKLPSRPNNRHYASLHSGFCSSVESEHAEELEESEEFDEGITQQLVRRRTDEGTDRLEGTFLVEFPENQRTASVHVPFCPAFEGTPKIDVVLLDGEDATLSVVKPKPFGVRIDAKRRENAVGTVRILVVAEN